MNRFWLLEAISLFISCGALISIASLLKAYDDEPLPQWSTSGTAIITGHINRKYSFSVMLSAVLSLIATVFKIALGIPVAASLGQLKWDWFADGHQLADFRCLILRRWFWDQFFRFGICAQGKHSQYYLQTIAVITLGSLTLDSLFNLWSHIPFQEFYRALRHRYPWLRSKIILFSSF